MHNCFILVKSAKQRITTKSEMRLKSEMNSGESNVLGIMLLDRSKEGC